MLILSRKLGQKIIINDNIVITVMETNGGTVKLGIDAPSGVKIYREEVYNAVKQENRAANSITTKNLDKVNKIRNIEDYIVDKFVAEDL